jgi:hypothetical protein
MSEPSSDPAPPAAPETSLPRWVPVLIGGVLVALAGLAVYTGMQYRNGTMVSIVRPHKAPARPPAGAPPGEPEAGASMIFPGESGDNAPAAHPPVNGRSRAVIEGGGPGAGINATVRIWARRGMLIRAVPKDALVYVNEVAVGQANQLASEPYEFPQPGSYTVRVVAPGFRERTYIVTAADNAPNELARIEAKLQKE